jgi:4-hydroxy-tetrahydrodipicolinate reductase
MTTPIRVCVAGATGWAGGAVTAAILRSKEFQLVGAVARRAAGEDVGVALASGRAGVVVSSSLEDALETPTDVLIDYTAPGAVRRHVLHALGRGAAVVVGTSGLTAADFIEIEGAAVAAGRGVIASGNFSVTAALATHFSLLAARHLPHWEIVDYADAGKIDVPSGTTRELAERLATVRAGEPGRPLEDLVGPKEARGADVAGSRVHSLRLPSYVISFETIFGLPDERLTLRHDAGAGAGPYVAGTLLAAREASRRPGLIRGLDRLLFGGGAA